MPPGGSSNWRCASPDPCLPWTAPVEDGRPHAQAPPLKRGAGIQANGAGLGNGPGPDPLARGGRFFGPGQPSGRVHPGPACRFRYRRGGSGQVGTRHTGDQAEAGRGELYRRRPGSATIGSISNTIPNAVSSPPLSSNCSIRPRPIRAISFSPTNPAGVGQDRAAGRFAATGNTGSPGVRDHGGNRPRPDRCLGTGVPAFRLEMP